MRKRRSFAAATVARDHGHAIAFGFTQSGSRAAGCDLACSAQRNAHFLAADVQLDTSAVFQIIVELKLKGDLFFGIGVIADMDLVDRIGVHGEIVGSTIGGLQRLIICNEGHVVAAVCLVAFEHVEICRVDLWLLGNARRLTVR